jgi:hypothetical protein
MAPRCERKVTRGMRGGWCRNPVAYVLSRADGASGHVCARHVTYYTERGWTATPVRGRA